MNDTAASHHYTGKIRTKFVSGAREGHPQRIEFVGASDDTIAEAVRRALARASESLRTLEGVGVLVIPQVYQDGPPRYRVTLRITETAPLQTTSTQTASPQVPPK